MIRRTRIDYWSHSWVAKLTAKWLGAPPRPEVGTIEEWNVFDKNQKQNFHTQDIVEDVLDKLQNFCLFPSDVYYTICVYLCNRFIDKHHLLQTKLNPGQYYEYETRLLYGMFNSFVQFIEQDQTLENLKWEMTLSNDEYGNYQAISAQEKMALYTWWKVTRPARVSGYEASGFAKWSAEQRKDNDSIFSILADAVSKEPRSALSKKWHEIDEQYEQEDEDMMIRLIRIRRTCWT